MTHPQTILGQARQGPVPAGWRIFTKKRGRVSGFLRGTSNDPDPLLVITLDGVVEYVSDRKPLTVVDFYDLAEISLSRQSERMGRSALSRRPKGKVAICVLLG
ncbi:hypothetical protein AB0D34_04430 [Streptomyces sp. NPDC048420]|uniref:hypothetical protein n=1 Tax=Streptomyces sp. NPDC048420 TaxID=3155755 RepID=UPI00341F151A